MQFYNVHTHSFTMNNAPKRFLHMYLPDAVASFVDNITATKAGANSVAWILSKLGNGSKRYASFLKIGKSADQLSVFENLMAQYNDPTMKFVALTMYMEKCGADVSESGFEGQLEEIIKVKQRYPDNLLVFMGIDPRWKFSGTELRKTVEFYFNKKVEINAVRSEYPFVGLKLYPSMGFYAFDEKLKETFEWAADNGVPVLSHCNYLGGIYTTDTSFLKSNINQFDVYAGKKYSDVYPTLSEPSYYEKKNTWKWLLGTNENNNNLNTASYFLEPQSFKTLLEYFSKKATPLKLCLAHFGGDEHILMDHNNSKPKSPLFGMLNTNWCTQIKNLMTLFPENLYTDISYAVHNKAIQDPIIEDLNHPVFGKRILFGTDYFLTEREMPEQNDYNNFRQCTESKTLSNYNNISAWEQIAHINTESFLKSNYYP